MSATAKPQPSNEKEHTMGLDMYLKAEKYIAGWEHLKPEAKKLYANCLALAGLKETDVSTLDCPSGVLSFNVGYRRKANAIHAWFVANVQNGVDECQPHHVERKQLEGLRDVCRRALVSTEHGKEVLPTKSGFFFGSTEYDDNYKQDVVDTIAIVDRCLSPVFEDWSFEYCSSW